MKTEVFIVAGEASADLHAAALVRELKALDPNLFFFGVGGNALKSEGMEVNVAADQLNIVGVTEFLGRAKEVWSLFRSLVRLVKKRRPACAILLDLPDFNLRMAAKLKAMQIPVVYYISPQVWAWRTYRVHRIKKLVDQMLVLFPFEKSFYEKYQVSVNFVGHPLLDHLRLRPHYRSHAEITQSPRIALLPGSRNSEIRHHQKVVIKTVSLLLKKYPGARFKIPVASTLDPEFLKSQFSDMPVEYSVNNSAEIIEWADLAMVASGTATLETSLIGTPLCLFYRVAPSTAFTLRLIFSYRGFAGMPNLLLGQEVIREFIQERAVPRDIADECIRLIEDENYRDIQKRNLVRCRNLLGESGASRRAALAVQCTIEKTFKTRGSISHVAPVFT
jgi:lipid-A-disaccharide synthase